MFLTQWTQDTYVGRKREQQEKLPQPYNKRIYRPKVGICGSGKMKTEPITNHKILTFTTHLTCNCSALKLLYFHSFFIS